jgi:hypothetical protein
MDWLNDIATAVKSAPSVSSTPPKQDSKPTSAQTDAKPTTVKSDTKPQADPKPTESTLPDVEPEQKAGSLASKQKGGAADWLGLNDADDEDEEPVVSWMTAKSQQKVFKLPGLQIICHQNFNKSLLYFCQFLSVTEDESRSSSCSTPSIHSFVCPSSLWVTQVQTSV